MKTIKYFIPLFLLFAGCGLPTPQSRELYVENHPDLEPRIEDAILRGAAVIGMTEEQVIASLGRPYEINRTVGEWGVHEQWIYSRYYGPYLYFEDGILTSWQD